MKRGFTLIELLIVISIIATLVALITANLLSSRNKARDAQRKHDLGQIKTALQLYYSDYQTYPASSADDIWGCGINGTAACSWGDTFTADTNNYMRAIPQDPVNQDPHIFTYTQTNAGEGFELRTYLENSGDPDDGKSQLRCGVIANISLKTDDLYVACHI